MGSYTLFDMGDDNATPSTLRLFPLNIVLMPGIRISLRIFEERYKQMISECIASDELFGVVLIKEGNEVGGQAIPYQIGTAAKIVKIETLDQGRLNIDILGKYRFEILETSESQTYLSGSVAELDENPENLDSEELTQARTLLSDFLGMKAGIRGGWIRDTEVENDPTLMSYTIAHYIELPLIARQRLLEIPTLGERIHHEIPLLQGAVKRLRKVLVDSTPYQGPKLN